MPPPSRPARETGPSGGSPANQPEPVATIGHGTLPFGELERLLDAAAVTTLVDVRSVPYSRHAPDFEKRRLERLCHEAGLAYRWLGDRLGGRPSDPELRTPDGGPDWEAIARSDGFAAGMDELLGLVRSAAVVLLCSEADPDRCHRSRLIAPALIEAGHPVLHLLHDGTVRPHQDPLF